jgi:hypothetical protein
MGAAASRLVTLSSGRGSCFYASDNGAGTHLPSRLVNGGRRTAAAAWEEVDEVEIEPQRAHDRLAAGDGAVVHRAVHLFDVLRVVGGEPGEDEFKTVR